MKFLLTFAVLAVASASHGPLRADDSDADHAFARDVAPLLDRYCNKCHGGDRPEADLSLQRFRQSANLPEQLETWQKVQKMLVAREMPPDDEPQPTEFERQTAIQTIDALLAQVDCGDERQPGRVTIRRLNRPEYNNTIRDLVGVDFKPADDFPSDDVGEGFDNISDVLSLPPILLEKYLAAAEKIVDKVFADEALKKQILVHRPDGAVRRTEAARRNLREFSTRAFRRPASDDEVDRLMTLYRLGRGGGGSDEDALRPALQAILASPHFLFRVEADPEPDDVGGIRELNDYELAARLSYFLWSSMPDEELMTLAGQNSLSEPGVLQSQVRRMLRDPKSVALVDNFAGQWLQLRDLATLAPDPDLYPDFDEPLRAAMLAETRLLFETLIREDRSVLDFLDADFSFVNERLARHYGIDGIEGDQFRRVNMPDQRRGVLTHASILLLTSNPTRTSPVKRGKWILDNVLGEPPPPPPEGIEELEEDAETLGSLRERMEQHRANESCAVCHRRMDPLGFGLENFDAIGAWRERDGTFPIDASGALPGDHAFDGPKQLMGILKQQKKDEFCHCLAHKMLTYALGRGLESHDRCAVQRIVEQLAEDDYQFGTLIAAIVMSDPFRYRASPGEN